MHLLAAVVDPEDDLALTAALRSPLFGLSDTALERLAAVPGRLGVAVADADVALEPDDTAALGEARRTLATLRAARDRVTVAELLTQAIDATGIEPVLAAQFHGAQKVANVRKLVGRARAGPRLHDAATTPRALLDQMPAARRCDRAADVDAVQVMTVHQARGLSFRSSSFRISGARRRATIASGHRSAPACSRRRRSAPGAIVWRTR